MSKDNVSLFNTVLNENNLLDKSIKSLKEKNSTDNKKSHYQNDRIVFFHNINSYLYYIYYILLLIFVIILIINRKKYLFLIYLIPILSLFPYVIRPIEILIYNISVYIFTFIKGVAYPGNAF